MTADGSLPLRPAVPGTIAAPLVLRHGSGQRYHVWEPFVYITRAGSRLTIRPGFTSDGGSIPWFAHWFCPPWGTEADEAFVLHDWLYVWGPFFGYNRADADALLLELMEVQQVSRLRRTVIYALLRALGRWSWRQHRRKD